MTLANFPLSRGVIVVVASWSGTIVGGVSGPGLVGGGAGSESPLDPGGVTVSFTSFGPLAAQASVRKVKDPLTELPLTDADVDLPTKTGVAGMQTVIS
jgi:hypothetical protein